MDSTPANIPFDADATAYSLNNAYWLAQASEIAYQEKSTIKPTVNELGLDRFEFLSRDDTEGFVAGNDNIIVVAFRGTEPTHLKDVLSDAKLHKVSSNLGDVHRGFLGAFDLVKQDMLDAIAELQDEENPQTVWVTGHSLGAALAVVAVSEMLVAGRAVSGLYNFGQPRVGSHDFAKKFNQLFQEKHFRFVNNNDVVTRVPPREFDYSHTGKLRFIDSDAQIQEDYTFWKIFLDRVRGRMDDFLTPGTDGLTDHFMGNYVESITQAARAKARAQY